MFSGEWVSANPDRKSGPDCANPEVAPFEGKRPSRFNIENPQPISFGTKLSPLRAADNSDRTRNAHAYGDRTVA